VRSRALLFLVGALAAACSAPASEGALVRTQADRAALDGLIGAGAAGGGRPGAGEAKARRVETPKVAWGDELHGRCPRSMAEIDGRFCIDRYEASLVDVSPTGEERVHSPFVPVDAHASVRAVSAPNVFPQGYISAVEAERACAGSGKRLCRVAEWKKACRGPEPSAFGYGDRREPGRCNDTGKNPVLSLYGGGHWTWTTMNLPALNQLDNTLARTGTHAGCTNGYGVYDMVGNLHEWVADPAGTFYGGYYQDVASVGHGEGCGYQTSAHEARYHDYSTGFRCCADVAGSPPPTAVRPSRGKRSPLER
jgi:hypothetical protein